jgi:ketosteroid isomerase-like protein
MTTQGGHAVSGLEDLEAIRRLTFEYAMAIDTMQLDALVDLFLPEAVLDHGPGDVPVANNRDEIRDFFKTVFEGSRNLFHLTSNNIIDVDGDAATGTVYYQVAGVTSEGASFGLNGYYADIYARTGDGWKFRRREVVLLLDLGDIDQAKG